MKLIRILAAVLAALFVSQIVLAESHRSAPERVNPGGQQGSIVYEYIM